MNIRSVFLFFFVLYSTFGFGQYTQIGTGGFPSSNFGPIRTDTASAYYSRFAFIYPKSTLTNLKPGDSISAISFQHRSFDSLRGKCSMKVYLKATNQSDFGAGSINWLAERRNGMTSIYEGNPSQLLGNTPGEVVFKLSQPYAWDTSGGRIHLQLLVEYTQTTNQVESMNWMVESSFYVPGFVSGNESKYIYGPSTNGLDSSTTFSSSIHPTLKIYHPNTTHDLEINKIYSLGTIPLLMVSPDSIKVVVSNVGKETIQNHKVYLSVSGSNTFKDSVTVSQIDPYTSTFIYFDSYNPSLQGTETLRIDAALDSNVSNNSISKNRTVNYNVYSHADPFSPNSGGIGFNGSTGDFVARFFVDGTSYINQIKVDFNSVGRSFQLGIWEVDANGYPGKELFMSDTSMSAAGTFIMSVLPRIAVTHSFYVGIRQAGMTNVGFSYQSEIPVRPHTFYFTAPAGDTTWTPFSPGFNFNFNIQPRLQVANDIAVLNSVSPIPDSAYYYDEFDSLEIKAQFINYGYQDQINIPVKAELYNRFGQLEYSNDQSTSILAGDSVTLSFGKISSYRLGDYSVEFSSNLASDSVIDNNARTIDFSFIKDHDVAVDQIFSPSYGDQFDLQREPLQMVVRAINYGVKSQNNLTVRMELVNQSNQIILSQDKVVNLLANSTTIIPFDTIYLPEHGDVFLRAFTLLSIDSFPQNDTMQVMINVRKVDDMMMLRAETPENQGFYAKDTTIVPYVIYRNDGISNQDSARIFCQILDDIGNIVYFDSIRQKSPYYTDKQAFFKSISLDVAGNFQFLAWVYIPDDQVRSNDTLISSFSVINSHDIQLLEVLQPNAVIPWNSIDTPFALVIRNNGKNATINAKISVDIENNQAERTYQDSIMVNLSRQTTDTFYLSDVSFAQVGDYYVTVINHSSLEDEPNPLDTIHTSYRVRYTQDLSIQSHLTPNDNDTLELNTLLYPSIQILNEGLETMATIRVVVELKDTGSNLLYTDTFTKSELLANRALNFTANQSWNAINPGSFTMTSWIENTDNNPRNDTLMSRFEVVKRRDIVLESVILPQEDLYKSQVYRPQVVLRNDGMDDLSAINVACDVFVDGGQIYQDINTFDLASGQSMIIRFDSSLMYPQSAKAKAIFWVDYADDQVNSNDTLKIDFEFVQGLWTANLADSDIQVYPNPFQNQLTIQSPSPIQSVRLVDVYGKLIDSEDMVDSNHLEWFMDIQSGTYILEIQTKEAWQRIPVTKLR